VRANAPAVVIVALGSLGLVVAILQRPGDRELALDAYFLFVGAIALWLLVRTMARAFPAAGPSELEQALRRPRPAPGRVPELERIERELVMSVQSAFDTYFRLRRTFREIAAERLERYGAELDRADGRAEELLGEAAWSIVRPGLERPHDHMAPGVPLARVEEAVTALERL
jgi:hypothetical protein